MATFTTTILDKILDGDVQISDLSLSLEETKQLLEDLKTRENTRENHNPVNNSSKQFLQEICDHENMSMLVNA